LLRDLIQKRSGNIDGEQEFSGIVSHAARTASLQDFFLAHVPCARQADIYAMAALVGAVILIVISATLAAIAGGVCCFVLRVVAG